MKTYDAKVIHFENGILQVDCGNDKYERYSVDEVLLPKCIELQVGNEIQILVDDTGNLIDVVKKEIK